MSGDYLADSPEHKFEPQDRLPDRCGFVSDGMTCGYDHEDHEALWPDEDAADIERDRQHWLGQLQAIPAKRAQQEQDERETVRQARLAGVSWWDIAMALDTDMGTARDKYGEPEGDPF